MLIVQKKKKIIVPQGEKKIRVFCDNKVNSNLNNKLQYKDQF